MIPQGGRALRLMQASVVTWAKGSVVGLLAALAVAAPAQGQTRISTDGSLGGAANLPAVSGEVFIDSDVGQIRGDALFHSFNEFKLTLGDRAVFDVDRTTARIISRVTGGAPTEINGRIRTNSFGGVDFWMINPAGIAIGPSGAIDTNGSIHLGAADALVFGDGAFFSTNLDAAPLLTTAPPVAFGFLDQAPGRVSVTGDALARGRGDVSLVGGEVIVDQASINAAPGGQILIAGVGASETVSLARRSTTNEAPSLARQTGIIRIRGEIEGTGAPTTRIRIDGSGVIALDASVVDIDGAEVSVGVLNNAVAGDGVRIDSGLVRVVNDGLVRTSTSGSAPAGDITVAGFTQLLLDRGLRIGQPTGQTVIESDTLGTGGAGELVLTGDAVVLRNRGRIFSNSLGAGDAGGVTIEVSRLRLVNGGQIGSGVLDPQDAPPATGKGGDVVVTARDRIVITGLADAPATPGEVRPPEPSGIFSSTEAQQGGAAGSVRLKTPRLRIANNGEVASETFNASEAGKLTIRANSVILLNSAEITTRVVDPRDPAGLGLAEGLARLPLGDAGKIVLRPLTEAAARLTIRSGAEIASDGSAGLASQAGRVRIVGDEVIVGQNAAITTNASTNEGGAITVRGTDLVQIDGSVTTSIIDGRGNGGRIRIGGEIGLVSSSGVVQANAGGVGDGGRVTLATDLFLQNFSGAIVEALGAQGAPGAIVILGDPDADTSETSDLPREFFDRFALIDDFCVAAVTGGSSLVLETLQPGGKVPALFGAIIPYPASAGGPSASSSAIKLAIAPSCAQG